jgi:fructose-1,6-bisphosphatase/sedoheptulose 1,7-bisphosphatase-like protein
MVMRTTIDIDQPILKELKRRGKAEGKSLGMLASELLAQALVKPRHAEAPSPFTWSSRPMGAKVDLADKDALFKALDESP